MANPMRLAKTPSTLARRSTPCRTAGQKRRRALGRALGRAIGLALYLAFCLTWAGCGRDIAADPTRTSPATAAGAPNPVSALVVTHGGAGSPPDWSPTCNAAARTGRRLLTAPDSPDRHALDGAIAAVVELENDPVFNAGTGANIRLDGKTIQMDAAVMTGDGDYAAVAVIERVRNPVLVARAVLDTPHRMLAGEGATRFAHRMGFADEVPTCAHAEAKYRRRIALLLAGEAGGGYDDFDWRRAWNYTTPPPNAAPEGGRLEAPETGDTVGAVARDALGNFAAALSTGGTSITLHGRVGDVPLYGCGCYAGPDGAVACTGFGEEIIRHTMARTVYEMLAAGLSAQQAVTKACRLFPDEHSLGVIAVGKHDWGVAANRQMAFGLAD